MQIDILIPTYNREKDVLANLELLQKQIEQAQAYSAIRVIICDNCSTDATEAVVARFLQQKPEAYQVLYYRNSSNIGLERNCVEVLAKATAPYVIFLGDDDFMAEGYLKYCLEQINAVPNLGCIIPGVTQFLADGSQLVVRPRGEAVHLPAGYESVYSHSHYGHQLSGVLCIRESLLDDYLATPQYRNPYLFIYFVANRLAKYAGIYAPNFQTLVNNFNAKDWGYNGVGLLDEVYKAYYPFISIYGEEKTTQLLLHFTVLHSYRLAFKTKNISKLREQYRYLLKTTPPLKGFRSGLFKFFVKEYLRTWIKG